MSMTEPRFLPTGSATSTLPSLHSARGRADEIRVASQCSRELSLHYGRHHERDFPTHIARFLQTIDRSAQAANKDRGCANLIRDENGDLSA